MEQIACPILMCTSLDDVKALHFFCATLPPFEQVGFHLLVHQITEQLALAVVAEWSDI